MSDVVELPYGFFKVYCEGFVSLEVRAETDPDFDLETADLEEFRGEAEVLREQAEEDGVLPEMKLALEYLISIDDSDIPRNKQHVSVLGAFVNVCLTGFGTPELHRLFEWARAVNFPDLPPMTDEDKAAAKNRVRPIEMDIDEWMEARGLERGSKPGVWQKRQGSPHEEKP